MSIPGAPHPGPGAPVGAEPVCPRHPERVSYVRCQRCERPACPECQRQAAVGVQCIDCVREQAKTVRSARTPFGGRPTDGRPLVTYGIIALCAVVFLAEKVPGLDVVGDFAFAPVLAASEPWRFLTAAFLHSPTFLPHILFNMVALWQVGPALERLFGRVRFAAVYLISAVAGSVGCLVLANPHDVMPGSSWATYSLGASGAVFGLFGSAAFVMRRLKLDARPLIAIIVINGVLGFVVSGIAWQAHLGGLVAGTAATAVLVEAPRTKRTAIQVAGLAAIVVVLAVASWLRIATAPDWGIG